MKTEQEINDKIAELKSGYEKLMSDKVAIGDTESIADFSAAAMGYSTGAVILEWVLSK